MRPMLSYYVRHRSHDCLSTAGYRGSYGLPPTMKYAPPHRTVPPALSSISRPHCRRFDLFSAIELSPRLILEALLPAAAYFGLPHSLHLPLARLSFISLFMQLLTR